LRARALFGGVAIVAAVAVWHRPAIDQSARAATATDECAGGTASFCTAVAGLSKALRDPILPFNRAAILPPRETPGAVDPAITQGNIDTTICVPGYAQAARPSYAVTGPLKRRLMQMQHPGESLADYELDHLIPISIGGAPLDLRDLWLQPRDGQANAGDKNVLAYVLWRLVCTHRLPLETAQSAIRSNWTKAYQTYATPKNVNEFHFRHGERDIQ
jgi:hypothetical protein